MSLKRTTVYADAEDLNVIKEAAARRGVAEAEIIREGIHLAAMSNRVWDEPFFSRTFSPGDETEEFAQATEAVWHDEAVRYRQTRNPHQ